jgi:ParB/RepB/Spo0J family partition protein
MAVKWQVENTRGSVYYFDPNYVVIKPELNGRADEPDLTELKASILQYGQKQPVMVRNENGKPVLVMGFSRWSAIMELNKGRKPEDRIKIAAVYEQCNEQDGYILNFEENRRRNATTPYDDAHQIKQLVNWGWDNKKISQRLKISPSTIAARLALLEIEPEVQAAVKKGLVKPAAVKKIAKLSAEQQRELVKTDGKVSDEAVAAVTHTPIKPNLKVVREFVEMHAGPGEDEAVQAFCKELLNFIDGKENARSAATS